MQQQWIEDLLIRFGPTKLLDTWSTERAHTDYRLPEFYGMEAPPSIMHAVSAPQAETLHIWTLSNMLYYYGDIYSMGQSFSLPCEAACPPKNSEDLPSDVAPQPVDLIENGYLYTVHHSAHNYYHFLIDYIGHGIYQSQLPVDVSPIMASWIPAPFHRPLNETILKTDVAIREKASIIFYKKLSLPTYMSKTDVVAFLRERTASIASSVDHKRIYITRRFASSRSVVNEADIMPMLHEFGFKIIECENLSINEQISIFKGAEIVCGPHGAGLSNIVFSAPGTHVIEIFIDKKDGTGDCFWRLGCAGKLDYYCVSGTHAVKPTDREGSEGHLHVDPTLLREALQKVCK